MKKFALLILLSFIEIIFAQDTQYWSEQYGTKSFYLGGAVIGSKLDLSATYYNPGALALMENPEIITGAKSFSLTNFKFKDGAGKNYDFKSLRGDAPPDLFAGLFTFGSTPQDRLVYSIIVRKRIHFRVSSSADDLRDITTAEPGNDKYFGMTQIVWDVNETWVGLTYSKILNKNIGLGITQYFSYFSVYSNLDINSQALLEDHSIISTHLERFIDTYNIKTLSKLGIFFDYKPLTMGLTATLPSINIFGSGKYLNNNFHTEQNNPNNTNYMDSYYFKDIKTYYPSSWTIGAGIAYDLGKSNIHFSIEWFAPVKPFSHMDIPPITNKTTGELEDIRLMQEYKSVTNAGIGWQHIFNSHFSLFGGATTNFTANPPGSINDISLSIWDIYQFTAGTVFTYKRIKMNTGIRYAFGNEGAEQIINYPTASTKNYLIGNRVMSNISYKSLKLVIGFSFILYNDNHEKPNKRG
jgi:hypothetical protein